MAWYIGNGNEAATERWAFAFSAKREWRPKLQSDIAKIHATNRDYTKAFFVSNQYIPDRTRAEIEDALRKKYGFDVRVFDRTWILDKVFGGRLEQLAIDELGLNTSTRREIRKGPLDAKREQDLQHLEERIETALREGRHSLVLVEDCIEAADLARGLERPRTEIDGLYMRADRLARQFGTPHQQVLSAYEYAWTSFFWHEDYHQFINLYTEVEQRASGSRNAYDLELWTNLFFLITIAVSNGELDAKAIDLKGRTSRLIAELNRLAQDRDRRSSALQARTLHLLVKLRIAKSEGVDRILRELKSVFRDSASLIGYPLEPLVEILTELGDVLGNFRGYEELFELVVQTASRREGEVSAARMLLTRGAQQMDAEQPYEAIRTLGRALGKLYKHESRHDAIRALYLCARAYEKVGLLWAARGTMLAASSIATNEFWTHDTVTPQQAVCYNHIKWIELRLGRIPHLLAWHQLDRLLRNVLAHKGYDSEHLFDDEIVFDAALGILLLRAGIPELYKLVLLPDALDELDLPNAAVALKYALGYENEVPAVFLGNPQSMEAPADFFRQWRDQPVASDLPPAPVLYGERAVSLTSNILGCRISVNTATQEPCIELAESLIAALESFLATGVPANMFAIEPNLTINIELSDLADMLFTFDTNDQDGRLNVEIRCRQFDPQVLDFDDQARMKERLFDVVVHLVARVFLFDDHKSILKRLFHDDEVPQRAFDFTTSFVVVGNVLGYKPKTTLEAWIKGYKPYPLTRVEPWDADDRHREATTPQARNPPEFADSSAEPPAELLAPRSVPHNQMETISLIRDNLWNEAGWFATGFAEFSKTPPILTLAFKNPQAARKIFAFWRAELGDRDEEDKLRVAIIRGISKTNPYTYRMVIGSDPATGLSKSNVTFVFATSRIHTMEPSSDENLKRFLGNYQVWGGYILSYGFERDGTLEFARENYLLKKHLVIREAWEVGWNDIDRLAINENDDPIIPEGQQEAPVLKLLSKRRTLRGKSRTSK